MIKTPKSPIPFFGDPRDSRCVIPTPSWHVYTEHSFHSIIDIAELELFRIEPGVYQELSWVDTEMEKLETVWNFRSGWNGEWNKLKVAVFKSLNCDDMDELAVGFQQKMKKLMGRDKGVQQWDAFMSLKEELERAMLE